MFSTHEWEGWRSLPVWSRNQAEISWCAHVEAKPSINERQSRERFRVGRGRMRIVKPEGREDFLSYSFALSHTWLRLIRARNRRRPPRVSTILPFAPSKPSYRSALEDSSVRARTTRAIDKSKSLRHCALVCGRQLRRISSPSTFTLIPGGKKNGSR